MNKGTYGYPLPPNAPTRVAPSEWRSSRNFTIPGTYSFTVPQNVYQLYGIAVGGGADGNSVFTTVPASTNMVFPGVALPNYQGMSSAVSAASAQQDFQICSFNGALYYHGNNAVFTIPNLGVASSTNLRNNPNSSGGAVIANGNLMVAIPNSTADQIAWTNNGTTWTSSTSVFNGDVTGYAWGATNANLVLIASTTTVQYTTNSAASFTTSAALSGLTGINGIAFGAGVHVVVGSGAANAGIATSPTGVTWTPRTSVNAAGSTFASVRFLNNQFIAVGAAGLINTSPDGITWTQRTSGTATNLNDVCYDATIGLYLIAGANGATNQYLTSPDGATWTLRSLNVSLSSNGSQLLACNALNGCFVITVRSGTASSTPVSATSTNGITWLLAGSNISFDANYAYSTPIITGGKMYYTVQAGGYSTLFVGCTRNMAGGGGGGFAGGILDVVPGQTLSVTVGSTGGTSSIGPAISATGGLSSGVPGTGVISNSVRSAVSASGGAGGASSLTNSLFTTTAWKVGGAGGGAAGWMGVAGGAGGASTNLGSGGGGGILLGDGGPSASSAGGGGGGAGFPGSAGQSGIGGSGGGTHSAASASSGGSGFSCSGGAVGATGGNGGNPITGVSVNYIEALRSGAFEGAGGGGSQTNAGGNGSGIGGGGGGSANSGGTAGAGGNGSAGAGGGGSGLSHTSSLGGGNGGPFGGGGGQATSNFPTAAFAGFGGSGGIGGGGGAMGVTQASPQTSNGLTGMTGASAGANIAGSRLNGAAGAGGTGFVGLLWTEGY